jgi:intergrase/recombinase
MDDYAQYEKDCERIRTENQELLGEFENWLHEANLGEKTIKKHINNVDFYINTFLLYEDATAAKDGTLEIGFFLGYWFIKKAVWASKASIKSNAASLKKFYTFLYQRGDIKEEALDNLKAQIKEEMPEWVATLQRYDDPSITDMGEVWGL